MVRFKNRWILVELLPTTEGKQTPPINGKQIWNALKQSLITNFGDTGWGAVGLSLTVKYYSPTTNMAIIRVGREHHRTAWAALTLLSSIEGFTFVPNVIHVSGTIKHAQMAAVEHNRIVVARYRALAQTPAGYRDSYDAYLDKSTAEIESLQD
ncbi:hypothetical protein BDV98DRAFT_651646 [Pterulicium gracile]|uniref:Uncharacterized protein n=1 Tax=Pterulicium gracile TaxID=1884261 RepID=A0A5C3Q6S4_9AGAR|nr:hypothetical protein BDV98DRAFT_651646 [Pterula gracilis]